MDFDIALILVPIVLFTGLITLLDICWFSKARIAKHGKDAKPNFIIEYSRSFFPVLALVLVLRSFLFEAYRIPSGSLEPTLLVNDFILVNKYDYGLRLPIINTKLVKMSEPKRGEIVVFHWPPKPSVYFIKRFVGMPGDHIQYKNKQLIINGVPAKQKFIRYTVDSDHKGRSWKVKELSEEINGVKHKIFVRPDIKAQDFDVVVPAGHYFAMGDNRDDSSDSRYWGFVPEHDLVGRATNVILSWNSNKDNFRWDRTWNKIQ